MNNCTFTGNLGRDAEVRYTKGGTAVLSFPIAIKHGYGDRAGTSWVQCALFGKRAEGKLSQYLTKGAQVCVSGEISLDEYQNRDGVTKTSLKLNVSDLDLVGGKRDGGDQSSQPASNQAPAQGSGFDDDEIPF